MAVLFDFRGNEITGSDLDQITNGVFADARTATASLAALNAEAVADLNSKAVALVDLRSAAFTGTVVFEASVDGTNYFALAAFNRATETMVTAHAGAGVVAGTNYAIGVSGFRRFRVRCSAFTSGALTVAIRCTSADVAIYSRPMPSTLHVTATAAANTITTATLPAAGAGLFHYITNINLMRNATAALAGTATLIHTTTNLPGNPAWSVGNAMVAGGTQLDLDYSPTTPLKSSVANTATTVVMPAAGAAVLNRINVSYYVGA